MRTVFVTQETHNGRNYRAMAEGKESIGNTIGAALDSLTSQLDQPERETIYIVKRDAPDEFFTADQQTRLQELMAKLHDMQAGKYVLTNAEQQELEDLVNEELDGVARRCEKIMALAK
jgi:sarcosine oxidase gamma subunit